MVQVCLLVIQLYIILVGGFKQYFPFHIWNVILPIDELIFFKMVKTTNQTWLFTRIYGLFTRYPHRD